MSCAWHVQLGLSIVSALVLFSSGVGEVADAEEPTAGTQLRQCVAEQLLESLRSEFAGGAASRTSLDPERRLPSGLPETPNSHLGGNHPFPHTGDGQQREKELATEPEHIQRMRTRPQTDWKFA